MYRVFLYNRPLGDQVVTQTYMRLIFEAIQKTKVSVDYGDSVTNLRKDEDTIIFDSCKLALPYVVEGFKHIFIWVQGVVPEEALMKGYRSYRYWAHSAIERYVLSKAEIVFFCSKAMRYHYESKYNLSFAGRCFIMPCFNELGVDEQAFMPEKYLHNNFVYAGSLHAWQCFEQTVQLYKAIESSANEHCKLYVYTGAQAEAERLLRTYQVEHYEVRFVEPEALGQELRRMKYGFVLREDCTVNRVATPTKLSNYIAHGVIPIYSDCLTSFHHWNEITHGPGVVCNIDDLITGKESILDAMTRDANVEDIQKWCEKTFAQYYDYEGYERAIADMIIRNTEIRGGADRE